MPNTLSDNPTFELAASFINYTSKNIFLTGKAGTGKTTFLHYIKSTCNKNTVVVAPTGVAAINAGGMTMHSFFQLPFTPFIAENTGTFDLFGENSNAHNKHTLLKKIRFNQNKRKLLKELELLIIDEISMVRADMMDAVDIILRHFRQKPNLPFGGVQLLLIGDLFQLPPVVINSEWQLLQNIYKSPFFFHANAFNINAPLCIELNKIYRQSDDEFIDLLNKVRNNNLNDSELKSLNSLYQPGFSPPENEQYITLCSHNYKARNINEHELAKLPEKTFEFFARIEGDFNDKAYPAEEILELKTGAQIMFIKNDKGIEKRYFNGKIGSIKKIENGNIWVEFPDESKPLLLEKEEWKNIRYKYNAAQKKLEEEEIGSFTQYPIRLAWAVTIHKSQGLTFEKAIIDAGDSFSPGQVYVALSRLKSKNGMVLHSLIKKNSIQCDQSVVRFMSDVLTDNSTLNQILRDEEILYIHKCIDESFDLNKLLTMIEDLSDSYKDRKIPHQEDAEGLVLNLLNTTKELNTHADKFRAQLKMISNSENEPYLIINERITAANNYFIPKLSELIDQLKAHINQYKNKSRVKKYLKEIHEILVECEHKISEIEQSKKLVEGLVNGKDQTQLLEDMGNEKNKHTYTEEPDIKNQKAKKGDSYKLSLKLYNDGMTVEEIASERGLATSTVEGHLLMAVKNEALSIYEFTETEKVEIILKELEKEGQKLSDIKANLGDSYTYNEIRAVMYYHENLSAEASDSNKT